jgi:mycofactocin precursor
MSVRARRSSPPSTDPPWRQRSKVSRDAPRSRNSRHGLPPLSRSRSTNVALSSTRTVVPAGRASCGGAGTRGSNSLTFGVFHQTRQNGERGGNVTPETLTQDAAKNIDAEVQELLVEEVSIDGLCGVY